MLNLDPGKLLVIAVVAIILLGPDRLPQVARQAGAAWRSFTQFRHRMESEVRSSLPDMPSSTEIARLARSPSALLEHLSSMSNGDDQEAQSTADDSTSGAVRGSASNGSTTDGAMLNANGSEADGTVVNGSEAATEPDDVSEPAVPAPPPAAPQRPAVSSAPEAVVHGDPTLN